MHGKPSLQKLNINNANLFYSQPSATGFNKSLTVINGSLTSHGAVSH